MGHAFQPMLGPLGNSSISCSNCGRYDEAYSRLEELCNVAQAQELIFMEAYMVPVAMCAIATGEGDHEKSVPGGRTLRNTSGDLSAARFYSPVCKCTHGPAHA